MRTKCAIFCVVLGLFLAGTSYPAGNTPSAELREAVGKVRNTFQKTAHPYARAEAMLGLQEFDEPGLVDILVQLLAQVGEARSNFIIRHTAARTISKMQSEESLQRILHFLEGSGRARQEGVRAVLVRGLVIRDDDLATRGVVTGLKDDHPVVRTEAARYAGRAGSAECIPLLIEMLGYRYREVEAQVHGALIGLTGCRLPSRKKPWEQWWAKNGEKIEELPVPEDLRVEEELHSWPEVRDHSFQCRTPAGRQQALRRYAFPRFRRPIMQSISGGLKWLADHQSEEGHWDVDGFWTGDPQYEGLTLETIEEEMKEREKAPDAWEERRPLPGIGSTGPAMDLPATGLALMAFSGAGHTHRHGNYREGVRAALDWLLTRQKKNGSFSNNMYVHAIAAHALIELWGMTRDPALRTPAQKATDFLCFAQNEGAGWRYGPNSGDSDSSVSSWCTMALQTARRCDLRVPARNLIWCRKFWEQVTVYSGEEEGKEYGQAFYVLNADGTHGGSGSYANTAASILCRLFMGTRHDARSVQAGAAYLGDASTDDVKPNIYMWIYATQAFFQMGGRPWAQWQKEVMPVTAGLQVQIKRGKRTGEEGSFWSQTRWISERLGRIGITAASCLVLESYFFYPRIENE